MNMSKSVTGLKSIGTTHKLRFKVGQLAAAMIGIPEEDERHNVIGRITRLDGEDVTLAVGEKQFNLTVSNLKQAVHYDRSVSAWIGEGRRADVTGLDHPELGQGWINTSIVLRYFPETGFFETRNTLYMADYVDIIGKAGETHRVHSPLLSKVHKT